MGLSCHRAPERYIRPKEQIYNTLWQAENPLGENRTAEQLALGRRLKEQNRVRNAGYLTSCSICHR